MVNDRNTHVGCGLSIFKTKSGSNKMMNSYLFACNYASTNIIGCPVYGTGKTAVACTSGTDMVFAGLCSESETVDANKGC